MMNIMPGNINNLPIILYLSSINLIAFLCMKIDKMFAQKNKRRISERNLMIIAIIGGSLGIWFGMFWNRHKTKKIKFSLGIPLIFVIQVVLFTLILL